MSTATHEAHATPEVLAPAIALNIETVELRGAERPNFAYLNEPAQEDYNDSHPGYFNRVRQGERSVVMATTVDEGHDWADSLATSTVSEVVAEHLDSRHFDGASEGDAISLMRRAVGASNAELRAAKAEEDRDPSWLTAEANVSAIRFFRDEEGHQKAVISNTGTNRVLKSTLDGTEVVMEAMVNSFGAPEHTVAGGTGVLADVKVVDVRPGERFIIVDSKLGEDSGPDASVADIDAVGGRRVTDNAAGAAADIADIPERRDEDAAYGSRIGDSTTVVVDVQAERDWSRAEKLLRMPTRAFVGMQIRAQGRRVRNREAYLENPTLRRRILATVDMGTVAAVGFFGYKAVSALVGLGHSGGGNAVQDALLHHQTSSAPTPSASTHNPFDNLTQHSSSPSASPDHAPGSTSAGAPLSTGEAPNPGVAPTIDLEHLDPHHLPAGVKLTDDQVKWLESSHSEGALGAYDSTPGADGLGNHGTVWHNAMESLKDAGYDPSKMSTDEKKAYVQHVLNLNHLSWDQATEVDNDFKPVMPTNQDIFVSMTHITAEHDGGPLMPSANSEMGQHLNDIKNTVTAQVAGQHGGHPGGTDGTQPGGRVPTDNGTPVTSHSTTTAPTTQPTAAPSADASSGVPENVQATNDWLESHETPILTSIAAAGAIGASAAAAYVIRNRNKVTVTGGEDFDGNGNLPEDLRGKAEPETRFSDDEDDEDEDEGEVIVERHSTGDPRVRPAAPGDRYGFIPPAPR